MPNETQKGRMERLNKEYADILAYNVEVFRTRQYGDDKRSKYISSYHAHLKQPNSSLNLMVVAKDLDELEDKLKDYREALGNTKLEENLDDQEVYLRTFEKQMPEYQGKIADIELGTTKKGEKMLSFKASGKQVRVLEYPKKGKSLYYYVDNKPIGFEGSVAHILEKVVEAKKPYQPRAFVLKGIQDGKSFDIAYDSSRQRLEDFKEELTPGNPDITMWVDENDDVPNASYKLEEASRNELLAKAKAETITRYNKSAGYKGFSLVDIDTTAIKTRDTIIITNRVGNYFDTIELNDILYWVGLEVDEAKDKKMTLEVVRRALLGAMDGMDIKVDCNCGDFVYRFAYMATVLEYKYGKPENRPSNITNPNGFGAMCKHLISLLSNKSWVKQVASTLQQWIVDEIDWVRQFLKVSEEDFKLPDEYARYLGKHGAMKKTWDKIAPPEEEQEDNEETNEDAPETEENEETTNDTPEEKATLNNQTNMPKAFRNNKQDEEDLEEK